MNVKHAYLIIAHNQFELLKVLLKVLDYPHNDIYVHLDSKVGDIDLQPFFEVVRKSNLYFLKNRVNVQWGAFSQIECELRLLEASVPSKYRYYHLMSGVDMPLKSQKEIHQFFDEHSGTEFVHFDAPEIDSKSYERVSKYNFFCSRNKRVIDRIAYRLIMMAQFGVDRARKNNLTYLKGANWFSITNTLAEYVVENRPLVEKQFRYTLCADEVFLQTLIINSDFINRLSPNNFCDNYETILYYIDWNRGRPYEFEFDDFAELMSSNMLFARKFNWNKDPRIILKICDSIVTLE